MRISCRLTFNVNFKPSIIKIGWELDILCYIFEIQRFDMQLLRFFSFFLFLSQFLPDLKILSKFRENVGLQAYCLGSVLNWSWTGLRTAVFSGPSLSQKNWEDRFSIHSAGYPNREIREKMFEFRDFAELCRYISSFNVSFFVAIYN